VGEARGGRQLVNLTEWQRWTSEHWLELVEGKHLEVPAGELEHPLSVGFERLVFTEPAGQAADYGLSLRDGSRLHVHAFADGTMTVHRDRIDPKRGVVAGVRHYLEEAPSAKITVTGALVLAGVAALRKVIL
jgi:hypothetical protein